MCRRFHTSVILAVAVSFLLNPLPVSACGPDFPNQILIGGDEAVFGAGQPGFEWELGRLVTDREPSPGIQYVPPPRTNDYWAPDTSVQTTLTDGTELSIALQEMGTSEAERARIVNAYGLLRAQLRLFARAMVRSGIDTRNGSNFEQGWREWLDQLQRNHWTVHGYRMESYPSVYDLTVPSGLPLEFELYVWGAIYYYQGEWCLARECWENLMNLPPEQRHYRSTWAAFMIGRTLLGEDPDRAYEWFRQTRTLAAHGFADSLGLAAETYRLEAENEFRQGDYQLSIKRYVDLFATGDDTEISGLRFAVRKVLDGNPDALQKAATDPLIREVVSAYIDSCYDCYVRENGDEEPLIRWLDELECVGATDLRLADHLAWVAYQSGRIDLARRWLARSEETGLSLWLKAKLEMREGRLIEACDLLERAADRFTSEEYWDGAEVQYRSMLDSDHTATTPRNRIIGELGVLQLSRGQYSQALDSFLRSNYWVDAAYVAESVLTPDELKAYVDRIWPGKWQVSPGPAEESWMDLYWSQQVMREGRQQQEYRIRYLLARRLARLGRWQEARQYYPDNLRSVFDSYVDGVRKGKDRKLSATVRADSYWEAAQTARNQGMELMGTELEPDWRLCDGHYDPYGVSGERLKHPGYSVVVRWGQGETERVARHREEVQPYERLHYRYIAADLAWSSAELMPDESDETARRLCIAGCWLKNRDPQAADRFYKAMVNRCRSTDLGRQADLLRWFPDCGS